jgi:hypothetical protein
VSGLLRKVIVIPATASPNVRLALAEIEAGKEPSHEQLVPGVLSYADYLVRRKTWDVVRATIGLRGLGAVRRKVSYWSLLY